MFFCGQRIHPTSNYLNKSSYWISADETVCAWKQKTLLHGFPNIPFYIRKSKQLGKFFACFLIKLVISYTKY
jgi:hypothetical protein